MAVKGTAHSQYRKIWTAGRKRKISNWLADEALLGAKKEARGKFELSEDDLDMASGGSNGDAEYRDWNDGPTPDCSWRTGDARGNIEEALADVDALMADVDGFDF